MHVERFNLSPLPPIEVVKCNHAPICKSPREELLEIILFSLFGIGLGIATGLVPGLHINNLIPIMLSLSAFVGDPYNLVAMIISMATVQVFINFIPSIFLGAPEADNSLSVLPGHRLLHEGRGFEAIKLTVIGGIGSLAVSVVLMFLLSSYFPAFYSASRPYIQYVLLGMVAFMVLSERKVKKIALALLIFFMSGLLGFLVLQSPLVPQQNVLFPTLAGLFGISVLATSVMQKSGIPRQSGDEGIRCTKTELMKSIAMGSVAGMLVGFLPAIGVSQAAAVFQHIGGLSDARNFLVSLSGINVANEVFSLNSVYLIGNPRSGASVATQKIMGDLSQQDVFLFVSIIIFSAAIGAFATLVLGKKIPPMLARLNYRWLSIGIIALLAGMALLLTGIWGALVLAASSSIGVLCNHLGIRKSNCMGVLLVPSILFFTGMTPLASEALGI